MLFFSILSIFFMSHIVSKSIYIVIKMSKDVCFLDFFFEKF